MQVNYESDDDDRDFYNVCYSCGCEVKNKKYVYCFKCIKNPKIHKCSYYDLSYKNVHSCHYKSIYEKCILHNKNITINQKLKNNKIENMQKNKHMDLLNGYIKGICYCCGVLNKKLDNKNKYCNDCKNILKKCYYPDCQNKSNNIACIFHTTPINKNLDSLYDSYKWMVEDCDNYDNIDNILF